MPGGNAGSVAAGIGQGGMVGAHRGVVTADLARMDESLQELAEVRVDEQAAIVCVVGAGLGHATPARERVVRELARWSPDLLAVGASPTGVAAVTLSWQAPTENVDGSPLNDLDKYRIYVGSSAHLDRRRDRVDDTGRHD